MQARIFKRYNNIGHASVAFSALKAGGFHPSWHNFHHAYTESLQMLALGGTIILVPESEYNDARDWIKSLRQNSELEFDPIKTRRFGMWKKVIGISLILVFPFFPIFIIAILGIFIHSYYFANHRNEDWKLNVH